MLSLQLFACPNINTNQISSLHRLNTLSSLAHFTAKSLTKRTNISSNSSLFSERFRFGLASTASDDSAISTSGFNDDEEEKCSAVQLAAGLQPELMPKHISVVMDGHRRWAENRMVPIEDAHRAETKTIKKLVMSCMKLGINVLSLFAMSTENYKTRSKEEIDSLVINSSVIALDMHDLIRRGLKVTVMGDKTTLPNSVASLATSAEVITKDNKGMHLVIGVNYGGRYDIIQASKKIATKVRDGVLDVEDVNDTLFDQHLETGELKFPHPDMIIRTSGELRISNFMLWQAAYSELLFVKKLFPDFEKADLVEALKEFQKRKRRYGG